MYFKNSGFTQPIAKLTHCGLMTPYGDMDLGQHWLGKWLFAWRHQVITWTRVDLSSVMFRGVHLRAFQAGIPYTINIACHRCGKHRKRDGRSVCWDINSIKPYKAYFLNMIVIAWRVRITFKRNVFTWLMNVYLMSSLFLMILATDKTSYVQYFESGRPQEYICCPINPCWTSLTVITVSNILIQPHTHSVMNISLVR